MRAASKVEKEAALAKGLVLRDAATGRKALSHSRLLVTLVAAFQVRCDGRVIDDLLYPNMFSLKEGVAKLSVFITPRTRKHPPMVPSIPLDAGCHSIWMAICLHKVKTGMLGWERWRERWSPAKNALADSPSAWGSWKPWQLLGSNRCWCAAVVVAFAVVVGGGGSCCGDVAVTVFAVILLEFFALRLRSVCLVRCTEEAE